MAARGRVVASILLLALGGCAPKTVTKDWQRLEPPIPAPDFILPQLDASSVRLSDLRGRVVIMEFWATWCGPCRFSMPSLEVVYKRFRDRGVTVVLVNEGEPAPRVRQWVGTRFTAPILLDEDMRVGRLYRISGIPRLFIVNQDGQLVYEHSGYGGGLERNLTLILDELLAEVASGHAG